MTVIVVDAGILATALLDDHVPGEAARARLRGSDVCAPELIDLEVLSVIRRLVAAGDVSADRAERAVDDLAALPIRRVAHRPLVDRCWELRHNLTPYDAAYVALAEALEITLLTADARLGRSPGPTCTIELLAAGR